MTKQEILDQFRDINYAYNNCTKLNTLSAMLDELLEAEQQWISVKDRFPEGECIAYSSKFGEMMIGFIGETDESDTGYCCDSNTEWLGDVTHWMPLPEPPKEG